MTVPVNYVDIRDQVIGILETANTTTANFDLSTGLDKRIQSIVSTDLAYTPKFKPSYPMVSVRLRQKTETPEDFNTQRFGRELSLNFEVYCIYDSMKDATRNLWDMVRNVEAILRSNPDLDSYSESRLFAPLINIGSVEYLDDFNKISAYNKSAVIEFDMKAVIDRTGLLYWDDETGAGSWDKNYWDES